MDKRIFNQLASLWEHPATSLIGKTVYYVEKGTIKSTRIKSINIEISFGIEVWFDNGKGIQVMDYELNRKKFPGELDPNYHLDFESAKDELLTMLSEKKVRVKAMTSPSA